MQIASVLIGQPEPLAPGKATLFWGYLDPKNHDVSVLPTLHLGMFNFQ